MGTLARREWGRGDQRAHHHPRRRSLHEEHSQPHAGAAASNDFDAWLDGSAGKEILMKAPPGLQEWIVNRPMNNVRVGDDDPATAVPAEPEAPPLPPELPPQGSLF